MADLLSIRDLRVYLDVDAGTVKAVDGVSFRVPAGGTVALVGESGSGKSVIAQSIMGILPRIARIESGEILFRDPRISADAPDSEIDLSRLDPRGPRMQRVRGDRLAIIFQEPMTALSPLHTIGDQVGETLALHRAGIGRAERRAAVIETLRLVGFPDPVKAERTYPFELSGGLRQRAMIAMALICRPALLIADEPTTALDVTIQAQILELIRAEQERRQLAVLLITHNLAVVSQVADRVAVLYAGEIVEEASASEIFANPRHPYTQGLLSSIPSAAGESRHLYTIPGRVPDPRLLPPACLFAPRCPYVISRCWQDHPALEVSSGHLLRCWNPQPFTALRAVEPEVDRSVATSE